MRRDDGLAFMLRYENIAWYDEARAELRILDRRIYPIRTEFVSCRRVEEVAAAIRDMVTQSYGPYTAAAMGMALAARSLAGKPAAEQLRGLEEAAEKLSTARPTTSRQMRRVCDRALARASAALAAGEGRLDLLLKEDAVAALEEKYERIEKQGRYLAELFPENARVMTQCFADTVVGMMLRACRELGKEPEFYCPETRPFYQGSRLTASCIADMDFPVTVICDNMPAWTLKEKKIDLFTSAADVITGDGHVINKVGTFQIALAAKYWHIPYYCTGDPDPEHPDLRAIIIEERDPAQVLESMGLRLSSAGVRGWYPAFDITPPELVSALVSTRGVFVPAELKSVFYEEDRL